MEELSKRDREVLTLLSDGHPDASVCRKLGLSHRQLEESLDRIRTRAEAHPEASAALYYERALRRRAENRERSLQGRFNALMGASTDAVLVANGRTGVILQANDNAARMFGYEHERLVGMSVEDLVPIDQRDHHPAYRLGFLANARKREMGYHPPIFGLRQDGSKLEMAIALTSSGHDDDMMVVCTEFTAWSSLGPERYLETRHTGV
jgi:PAS domain S-box-containing protein